MTIDHFVLSASNSNPIVVPSFGTVPQLKQHTPLEGSSQEMPNMSRKGLKRHIDEDEDPYVPRSKKPYEEKMSSYLSRLDISGESSFHDGPQIEEVESWFPNEQEPADMFDEGPLSYIEEPLASETNDSDTSNSPTEIRLTEELKNFIDSCKKENHLIKSKVKTGNEVILWQPNGIDAFLDTSMYGRINEIESTEEDSNQNDDADYHYITLPDEASFGSPETITSSPLTIAGDLNEAAHYQDEEFIDLTMSKEEDAMDLG